MLLSSPLVQLPPQWVFSSLPCTHSTSTSNRIQSRAPPTLDNGNSRRRALGGRYCLVCSLVARSAATGSTSTNTGNHQANSNVMAVSGGATSLGNQRRQPLGYLGPGTVPRTGPSVQQHQGRALKVGEEGAAGVPPSVAISRVRRGACGSGGGGCASPQQRQGMQVSFQQQPKMVMPKDGKFFRPLPRARRGSWGGERKLL